MGKIKSFILKLINLTPLTKELSVKLYRTLKEYRYRALKKRIQTDDKMVVFESFLGKQFACSPKALFLSMVEDPKYSDYKKVWMFKNPEEYKELERYDNTEVVLYGSSRYYECYARAKYWITNYHLPTGISKREDQIYVQTWHGTPLKKIGCDVGTPDKLSNEKKRAWHEYRHEGTMIDYMPSPSAFYTEKITSAFLLGSQAKVLEKGYPRNDFLFTYKEEFCKTQRQKLKIPADKKVILYAPTWRDNQHVPGQGYVYQCGVDFDKWKDVLGDEYVVLFRAHYLISNSFDFEKYTGFVINASTYDDINHLYVISDILITDYSSVFFDYANLNRPILFYMYDYEEYKSEMRDFYFGIEALPGPVIQKEDRLIEMIRDTDWENFVPKESYLQFNKKYNPYPGECSKAILDEIIK